MNKPKYIKYRESLGKPLCDLTEEEFKKYGHQFIDYLIKEVEHLRSNNE